MPDRWREGSPSTFRAVAKIGEKLIGLSAFVLAVILFLPIPFGHTVPALAIAIMALAGLSWHGRAAISGTLVRVAGLAVVSGVVVGVMKGAIFIVNRSFLEMRFHRFGDPKTLDSIGIEKPRAQFANEEEQLEWLTETSNKLVTALRPRLSRLIS